MALEKITSFSKPVSALADRPRISAADLKAWFDSNTTNEVKTCINNMIDALQATSGAGEIGANVDGIAQQTVLGVLTALKTLVDDRYTIAQIDTKLGTKFDTANAQDLVKTVNVDTTTGIITVTKYDGTQQTWDTAIEKVALDVELDGTEFVLTLADGTQQRVELSAFIDTYNFISTETIAATTSGTGNNKSIKFDLRPGSVTTTMMDPELLSTIQGFVDSASASATNASNSAAAALSSQNAAKSSQDAAFLSEQNAGQSEANAYEYMLAARQASSDASSSASDADAAADRAEDAAARAESIVGGDYLVKTDIVNDLTSGGIAKVLSAEQGKILNQNKVNKADIINDLTTGGSEKALSAEQGKQLNNTKAPLASPAFTGTPTSPDLTDESADGQITNKKYVDTELINLESDLSQDIGEVAQGLLDLESSMNTLNQNIANKINRTDTKTFFLEPSKWVDGKYTLDTTGLGWTANSLLQPNDKFNQDSASGIEVVRDEQTSTQVVLKRNPAPTEPVILTLLYGGEETTNYYVIDEIGAQTITVKRSEMRTRIVFDNEEDTLVYYVPDTLNEKTAFQNKADTEYLTEITDSDVMTHTILGKNYYHVQNYFSPSPDFIYTLLKGGTSIQMEALFKVDTSEYVAKNALGISFTNASSVLKLRALISIEGRYQTVNAYGLDTETEKSFTVDSSGVIHLKIQLTPNGSNVKGTFYVNGKVIARNVDCGTTTPNLSNLTSKSLRFFVDGYSSDVSANDKHLTREFRVLTTFTDDVRTIDSPNFIHDEEYLYEWEEEIEVQVNEKTWLNIDGNDVYAYERVFYYPYTADENTTVLLNGEKLEDESNNPKTISSSTGISVSSEQQLDVARNNLKFAGTNGLVFNASDDIAVGESDLTVEWFEYRTVASGTPFNLGGASGVLMYCSNGKGLLHVSSDGSTFNVFDGAEVCDFILNAWTHYALVKQGTTWTLYQNGTQIWTQEASTNVTNNGTTLIVGSHTSDTTPFTGYMSNFRVSKMARYTANFDIEVEDWVKYYGESPIPVPPTPTTDFEKLTSGEAYKYYNVGDTVTIHMYNYGDVQFDVVGKNHDGANTITLCPKNVVSLHSFNNSYAYYDSSLIRTYLNSNILNEFDSAIQNAIKPVSKLYYKNSLTELTDKVWLFSLVEVGAELVSATASYEEGTKYDFFANDSKRIKQYEGTSRAWWLRTKNNAVNTENLEVTILGRAQPRGVTSSSIGVVFGLVF